MAVKKSKTKKRKAVKKVAPKRKVAKKVAKKAVPKKVIAKKKPAKITTATKTFTKTEIFRTIAEHVGVTKKEVGEVFEVLNKIIAAHIKSGAVGTFKLDILKVEKIRKPAKKARKGINPFTGEEMMFKAKPAHNVIKIRALKKLKEMV